ncbi:MAG: hypothetical protein ABI590_06430, partial [Ilumatobacteraceae bacterium]
MATGRGFINDSFLLTGYKLASALARFTPAPLVFGAAMALAPPFSIGMRDERKMVERHLRRVDPTLKDYALRQAVQRSFQSYARYYLETFRIPTLSRQTI